MLLCTGSALQKNIYIFLQAVCPLAQLRQSYKLATTGVYHRLCLELFCTRQRRELQRENAFECPAHYNCNCLKKAVLKMCIAKTFLWRYQEFCEFTAKQLFTTYLLHSICRRTKSLYLLPGQLADQNRRFADYVIFQKCLD